jgi:hypothetical protein
LQNCDEESITRSFIEGRSFKEAFDAIERYRMAVNANEDQWVVKDIEERSGVIFSQRTTERSA